MTVSDSIDFSISADDLVASALRIVQVITGDQTPTSGQRSNGRQALNMLCKQWTAPPNPIAPGLKMWVRTTGTITLTLNDPTYEIKTGGDLDLDVPPVRVLRAWLRDNNNYDSPLTQYDDKEWDALSSKGIDAGTPTAFFYDRQLTIGWIYLNVKPNDITTYPSLIVRYLRTIDDFDSGVDTPFFPQEWYRALKFNLALDLAAEYNKSVTQTMSNRAQESLLLANSIQPEVGSEEDYFQPGLD
jgi:hypothetical protein